MHPALTAFITMNNYFHDIAAMLLPASGIIMWTVLRRYINSGATSASVLGVHKRMRVVVTVSVAWISLGAIPRILMFTKFELFNAAGKRDITGLLAKHALAFAAVLCGALLWIHLNRRIRAIPTLTSGGADH